MKSGLTVARAPDSTVDVRDLIGNLDYFLQSDGLSDRVKAAAMIASATSDDSIAEDLQSALWQLAERVNATAQMVDDLTS